MSVRWRRWIHDDGWVTALLQREVIHPYRTESYAQRLGSRSQRNNDWTRRVRTTEEVIELRKIAQHGTGQIPSIQLQPGGGGCSVSGEAATTKRAISGEARLRIATGGAVYDESIWPSLHNSCRVVDLACLANGVFCTVWEFSVLGECNKSLNSVLANDDDHRESPLPTVSTPAWCLDGDRVCLRSFRPSRGRPGL